MNHHITHGPEIQAAVDACQILANAMHIASPISSAFRGADGDPFYVSRRIEPLYVGGNSKTADPSSISRRLALKRYGRKHESKTPDPQDPKNAEADLNGPIRRDRSFEDHLETFRGQQLLTAPAGEGKSYSTAVCFSRLALRLKDDLHTLRILDDEAVLPLWLRFSDIARSAGASSDWIKILESAVLCAYPDFEANRPALDFVLTCAREGRIRLILDGADEPRPDQIEPAYAFIHAAEPLRAGGSALLVTIREARLAEHSELFSKALSDPGESRPIQLWNLCSLSDFEREEFIYQYFADDSDQAESLRRWLEKNPISDGLMGAPLFIGMIARLHAEGSLPDLPKPGQVFSLMIDSQLTGRWRPGEQPKLWTALLEQCGGSEDEAVACLRRILREIGLVLFQDFPELEREFHASDHFAPASEMAAERARSAAAKTPADSRDGASLRLRRQAFDRFNASAASPASALLSLLEHRGMAVKIGGNEWIFGHRTYLTFFVGDALADRPFKEWKEDLRDNTGFKDKEFIGINTRYEEPIAFAVGLMPDATAVIRQLLWTRFWERDDGRGSMFGLIVRLIGQARRVVSKLAERIGRKAAKRNDSTLLREGALNVDFQRGAGEYLIKKAVLRERTYYGIHVYQNLASVGYEPGLDHMAKLVEAILNKDDLRIEDLSPSLNVMLDRDCQGTLQMMTGVREAGSKATYRWSLKDFTPSGENLIWKTLFECIEWGLGASDSQLALLLVTRMTRAWPKLAGQISPQSGRNGV
ncbi:MAG: hypothetical protein ACI8UO_006395 [Verrucomicrobiales bacterium]|jgi:hypothetical protein